MKTCECTITFTSVVCVFHSDHKFLIDFVCSGHFPWCFWVNVGIGIFHGFPSSSFLIAAMVLDGWQSKIHSIQYVTAHWLLVSLFSLTGTLEEAYLLTFRRDLVFDWFSSRPKMTTALWNYGTLTMASVHAQWDLLNTLLTLRRNKVYVDFWSRQICPDYVAKPY